MSLTKIGDRCVLPYIDGYSQVFAIAWDVDGHILYCNKSFMTLQQFDSEPMGANVADYICFPDESWRDAGNADNPLRLSLRLKTKEADYRCDAVIFSCEPGFIAFCEKPILLQSDLVDTMAQLNRELANLTWELNQKSLAIEGINQALEEERSQLQSSEQRYRQLVEDSNVIILMFDEAGQIRYLNEHGRLFFEYDAEEIVGRRLADTIVPEFDSAGNNPWKALADTLSTVATSQRFTAENQARSGKRVWIDWTLRRRVELAGEPSEFMGIGIDVTSAKRRRDEEKHGHNRQRRSDMLNDAIAKQLSIEELKKAGAQIGMEFSEASVCLVFLTDETSLSDESATDPVEMQQQHQLLVDGLHDAACRVAWLIPQGIAVLQPIPAQGEVFLRGQAMAMASETAASLNRCAPNLTFRCGVSHNPHRMTTLAPLFSQALAAARYGPTLVGSRKMYHWQDLGSYQFVVRDLHSAESAQFIEDQLGPLLAIRNPDKKAALLRTLEEVVANDSVDIIGKRLNIVSRTVRYRKQLLEKILGVNLDSLENRANLSLAMKMMSIIGRQG